MGAAPILYPQVFSLETRWEKGQGVESTHTTQRDLSPAVLLGNPSGKRLIVAIWGNIIQILQRR